jgi:hypothetical protein
VRASWAFCAVFGVERKFLPAFMTSMDSPEMLARFIIGVAVRILVPVVGDSWAVIAAFVTTSAAGSSFSRLPGHQVVAHVAVPPNTLADFLVDQVLFAGLVRTLQDDLLGVVVTRDDRCHILVSSLEGFSLLSVGLPFRLGPFWWMSDALLASNMVAARAFIAGAE